MAAVLGRRVSGRPEVVFGPQALLGEFTVKRKNFPTQLDKLGLFPRVRRTDELAAVRENHLSEFRKVTRLRKFRERRGSAVKLFAVIHRQNLFLAHGAQVDNRRRDLILDAHQIAPEHRYSAPHSLGIWEHHAVQYI
jgi:hypothetical protein